MQSQAKLKVTVAPSVWNRLMFWAHNKKGLEVSAMGLVPAKSLSKGEIYVKDIVMLSQENSSVYTEMDDEAMNKYYEEQFAEEKKIGEFGCVWLHTHPSESCTPSSIDEETFKKTFSRHPWALMLILGKGGDMFGRIKNNFPHIEQEVEVVVDWTDWESIIDTDDWATQYDEKVRKKPIELVVTGNRGNVEEIYGTSGFYGRTSPPYITNKVYNNRLRQLAFGPNNDGVGGENWVDYAPFSECPTGLGSAEMCYSWLKDAKKVAKRKDGTPELLNRRTNIIGQMEHGTLYESEVKYLLWLNWWLKEKNLDPIYPSNWVLFVNQESITIKYGKKGPTLSHIVPPENTFGAGLNSDIPLELKGCPS